tara:strand:+ start:324 stop:542 length:219 start_codon:yes stop_codon:yes gene_type:complete
MDKFELESGNFFEGQKEFRKKYRDNVKGWYNGLIHLIMIFIIGGVGIYYFSQHISNVLWWEWLIIPTTFNIF